MTNSVIGASQLKPGVNMPEIIMDDTPPWYTVTWELCVVLGVVAIVFAFLRGWRNHKRGQSAANCAKVTAIAATLILASSLLKSLFSLAYCLSLFADIGFASKAGLSILTIEISESAKELGFSIGLATIGVIAYILMPRDVGKEDGKPR